MSIPTRQTATMSGDPVLSQLAVLGTQVAALSDHLPAVLIKINRIYDLLAGQRKASFVVEEVAALTGRSEYTIRRWIGEGKLKAVRLAEGGPRGRLLVPREELDRLVASGLGAEIPASALDQKTTAELNSG